MLGQCANSSECYKWSAIVYCIYAPLSLTPPPPHTHTHTHTHISSYGRTLEDKNKRATGSVKGLGNFEAIFPKQLEEELVNYILIYFID